MADRTPSTCRRSWSKRLKQALNKVETLFGEFASKDPVVGSFPVPTSPTRTPTPAAYPEPATPPGWRARTPAGQHDHEATGSNHTSTHTSEYFDATDPSQLEAYLLQHRIGDYAEFETARLRNRLQYGSEQEYEHAQQGTERPQYGFPPGNEFSQFGNCEHPQLGTNHYQNESEHGLQQGFERPHPGFEEQLAGSFGNIFLNTPTASQASHPHPWDDHPFLNPAAPVSEHHHHDPPVPEYYYSGELNPSWFQPDDATASHATSMAQQQTTTTATPTGYGGMSVRTGETGDSRESLMDTAGTSTVTSPYILAPVDEEKPSILPRPFNKIYVELRRFARGDEVAFGSARMGRGMRVLGRAFCYTLRLRKTVMRMRLARSQRKRSWSEPQRPQNPRQQCTKKIRPGGVVPTTSGASSQSTTEHRYKGITLRNGNWVGEIRVSACKANPKAKVWIGTFSSEREAALALDAGYYHCTEKYNKKFNFPQFVNELGESRYQTVLALYNAGREQEAKDLVKTLAAAHAVKFGAP